jgi:hypothetical protein
MAKKSIIEKTVRAAVGAAKEVINPSSPLAKQMMAAAAAQAVGIAEARAKEALPKIEKALKKAVSENVVKPVDSMLEDDQAAPAQKRTPVPAEKRKRGGAKKSTRRKAARSTAASRNKRAKVARSRPRTAKATGGKSARKTKRSKARRR